MPRTNRHFEPDTIYHVTLRGVERRPIFGTDDDRRYYVVLMAEQLRKAGCSLFADCLMGNHTHALIGVSKVPLGVPLHKILTAYAMRFNSANQRVGHLFQSRFFSSPIHDARYLQNAIAYIHQNPVRAGMVEDVSDWKWSSHEEWRTLSSGRIDFDRLEDLVDTPIEALREQYLLRISTTDHSGPRGLGIPELIAETAGMLGIDPADITSGKRGALYTKAKAILARLAAKEGITAHALADALNCTTAALRMARRRRTRQA